MRGVQSRRTSVGCCTQMTATEQRMFLCAGHIRPDGVHFKSLVFVTNQHHTQELCDILHMKIYPTKCYEKFNYKSFLYQIFCCCNFITLTKHSIKRQQCKNPEL